jgi:hypothetical protein
MYGETDKFIVLPVIQLKMLLLLVSSPKDNIDGMYNSVIDVQFSKPLSPIEVKFGR